MGECLGLADVGFECCADLRQVGVIPSVCRPSFRCDLRDPIASRIHRRNGRLVSSRHRLTGAEPSDGPVPPLGSCLAGWESVRSPVVAAGQVGVAGNYGNPLVGRAPNQVGTGRKTVLVELLIRGIRQLGGGSDGSSLSSRRWNESTVSVHYIVALPVW